MIITLHSVALALNLTALAVLLLKNSVNVPKAQSFADALQKTLVHRVKVVHDFVVVKAPTGPVHVHPVREHNAEDVTETGGQRNELTGMKYELKEMIF